MISTSSSECDCTRPFPFNTAIPNFIGNPFDCGTRQPLIYYAKIEEPCCQQEIRGPPKNYPNCFMKAFQWYSQERASSNKNGSGGFQEHISDFAAWLDKKYSAYLKRQQDESQLVLKQSTTLKEDKMCKKKSKKLRLIRSPWKRRRHANSKEKGDSPIVIRNESIEFILQPQDLCKPASECFQRISRIQSSTTIISKESPKCTKTKLKSKSLLSVYRAQDKEVKTKTRGKVVCECRKNNKGIQYETLSLESLSTSRNYNAKTPGLEGVNVGDVIEKRYSRKKVPVSDVLCECGKQNKDSSVLKYDTETQEGRSNEQCKSPEKVNVGDEIEKRHSRQKNRVSDISCQCEKQSKDLPVLKYDTEIEDGRSNEQYNKSNTKDQEYNSGESKIRVSFTGKPNKNMIISQSCSAQTSDHSINIANLKCQPLFLKVIHVSK